MFESIKKSVSGILQSLGVHAEGLALVSVIEKYLESSEGTAKIVGMKNNKIYIEAESSVQLQDLTFKKQEILKAVGDTFPLRNAPELKIFVKGMARPGAWQRLGSRKTHLASSAKRKPSPLKFGGNQ
jgi:hypothetical protein